MGKKMIPLSTTVLRNREWFYNNDFRWSPGMGTGLDVLLTRQSSWS